MVRFSSVVFINKEHASQKEKTKDIPGQNQAWEPCLGFHTEQEVVGRSLRETYKQDLSLQAFNMKLQVTLVTWGNPPSLNVRTVQSPVGLQYAFTTCPLGSGHQTSSFTAPYTASPLSGSLRKWLCKHLKGKSLIIILKEDINWLCLQAHRGTLSPEVCQHNLFSHFR